jgi:hypothetical protein
MVVHKGFLVKLWKAIREFDSIDMVNPTRPLVPRFRAFKPEKNNSTPKVIDGVISMTPCPFTIEGSTALNPTVAENEGDIKSKLIRVAATRIIKLFFIFFSFSFLLSGFVNALN